MAKSTAKSDPAAKLSFEAMSAEDETESCRTPRGPHGRKMLETRVSLHHQGFAAQVVHLIKDSIYTHAQRHPLLRRCLKPISPGSALVMPLDLFEAAVYRAFNPLHLLRLSRRITRVFC